MLGTDIKLFELERNLEENIGNGDVEVDLTILDPFCTHLVSTRFNTFQQLVPQVPTTGQRRPQWCGGGQRSFTTSWPRVMHPAWQDGVDGGRRDVWDVWAMCPFLGHHIYPYLGHLIDPKKELYLIEPE